MHGGLLHLRDNPDHLAQTKAHGIEPIDLVVVNLYPFEKTIAKEGVTLEEAIENIDIGGPSMLRSAAKNYRSVTVVVDPEDYADVLENIKANDGATTLKLRERLGIKVFVTTSKYDGAIANFLNKEQETTCSFSISMPCQARLRYGENPHQTAALYGQFDEHFQKLHGKDLSYNNILDITAASELIEEFEEPTVAILKHMNPCGVGTDSDLRAAWDKAFAKTRRRDILRRDHCLQSPADRAARPGDLGDIFRGDHCAGVRAGCPRALAKEKEPPADEEAQRRNRLTRMRTC